MKKKELKKFSEKLKHLGTQLNFNDTIPKIHYPRETKIASRLYFSKLIDQNTDLINTIEHQINSDLKKINKTLNSK